MVDLLDPKEIEDFARFLCDSDGNPPDLLVTAYVPMHGRGYLKSHRIQEAAHQWMPAWHAYQSIAVAALGYMKSRNTKE